jgi:predicted lipoprotein
MRFGRSFLLLILALVTLSGCTIATIRSLEEDEVAKEGFSPENYVAGIWNEEFLPTMTESSVEIVDLLSALDADEEATIEQYGNRTSTGPYSFMAREVSVSLSLISADRQALPDGPHCAAGESPTGGSG